MEKDLKSKLFDGFVLFCFCILVLYSLSKIPILPFSEQFQLIFPKVGKEIENLKETFDFGILKKAENLPKEKTKINLKVFSGKDNFEVELIISGNDIYWKSVSENKLLEKFFEPFFSWYKTETKKENVEELEKFKKILEKNNIFANFNKNGQQINFELNIENLKKAIREWKPEIKKEDLDNVFQGLGGIVGKIFVKDNLIKNLELEANSVKIILELVEVNKELKKEKNLENFLLSLLKYQI